MLTVALGSEATSPLLRPSSLTSRLTDGAGSPRESLEDMPRGWCGHDAVGRWRGCLRGCGSGLSCPGCTHRAGSLAFACSVAAPQTGIKTHLWVPHPPPAPVSSSPRPGALPGSGPKTESLWDRHRQLRGYSGLCQHCQGPSSPSLLLKSLGSPSRCRKQSCTPKGSCRCRLASDDGGRGAGPGALVEPETMPVETLHCVFACAAEAP